MAPTPTRTYGPLHLEDLEPHRFEDLVRQLIYDFRPWRQLEATGRGGGDDGFDARGYEIVSGVAYAAPADEDDADERDIDPAAPDRLWLVQCKREKAIGKTKLVKYLDGLAERAGQIDALLFVGACDFSKDARDAFRDKAREMGLSEAHLWGKGELEDQLFQPKNDHLLFAYFGISLQSQKRSAKTAVRARLATRKKAKKFLTPHTEVLIRDAEDDRYPYLDKDIGQPKRWDRGRWRLFSVEGCNHDGVHLVANRHYASLDAEGRWDFVPYVDDGPVKWNDPWSGRDPWGGEPDEEDVLRSVAGSVWHALPENEKAWVERCLILPYENIVAIDEDGDEVCQNAHVYVTVSPVTGLPFRSDLTGELKTIDTYNPRYGSGDQALRNKRFPTKEEALDMAQAQHVAQEAKIADAVAQTEAASRTDDEK